MHSKILFTLSLFLLNASFRYKSEIPHRIVLKTGKISITEYELEKNLDLFLADYTREKGSRPNRTAIANWINSFIDRTYFLADACNKGYDTAAEVNKWVASMAHYVVSKPGGLLIEKMSAGITVSEQELRAALQKYAKRVHISYLKFADYNTAISFLHGNFELTDRKLFQQAFEEHSGCALFSARDVVQWPFLSRGEKEAEILDLKKNELSPLLSLADGFYLVRADSVEEIPVSLQTDSVKNKLRKVLQQHKMQQLQEAYGEEVIAKAQIKFNAPVRAQLTGYLKQRQFNKNEYNAGDQPVLFWFKCGDTVQAVTTTRFMNYYNTLPLRKEMAQEDALPYYAGAFVYDQYAWYKAEAYGITRSLQFRLDENNYRNNVMWARYESKEMKTGITVSEEEVRNKYGSVKDSFICATDVVISAFSFNDRRAAISAMRNIRTGHAGEKGSGMQPVYTHASINYKEELFSDSIRHVVFSMKKPGLVMPFSFQGKFVVIIKESEQGRRMAGLPEVRPQLVKMILAEKLAAKEKDCLLRLKKLFTSINTIDYQKYFNTLPGKKG